MIHHYILTRFNLALWKEDKNGDAIEREEIKSYRNLCPQINFVGVKAEYACWFADIFRHVVLTDLKQGGGRW